MASKKKLPTSVSASSGVGRVTNVEMSQVSLIHDSLTFENRQATRLKDMEKRIEAEMKRKKRDWERQVERMREEFLKLYPNDRKWGSEELLGDPYVLKRRGSTDVLDTKKMKTLAMEYPDSGRRYKLRYDLRQFDLKSVKISCDHDKIAVSAIKLETDQNGTTTAREYSRKIEKPREVDHEKIKGYLTSDGILIVEAPLPPSSLDLTRATSSPRRGHHLSRSHHGSSKSRSRSSSNSPVTPSNKEKIGVPIFRDEFGQRRMRLVVDVGPYFKPKDITVQVIKENRILVKARHEERTSERLSKSKYSKEYELPEKIETYSLRGGLSSDGKLIVGAFAKGYGDGMGKAGTTGEPVIEGLQSCNVLDLASFPPKMPSVAISISSNCS